MGASEIKTFKIADPEKRFAGWPLCLEYIDAHNWRLQSSLSYRTAGGEVSTVRPGFVFDFASVPRVLWWLYPPAGTQENPYGVAALFHDWLCAHRKIGGRPIGFSEANAVFKEIMLYLGCRKTLAWTMYLAVQSPIGWWLWKKRKPEDMEP
ncbi:MAG: DUF1353 domain-containing protein [Dehalococcoidia bacterium]|jgi:hypothetical protein